MLFFYSDIIYLYGGYMKKKFKVLLFIFISLILVTGCVNKKENENKKKTDVIEDTEDKLIINGYDLTLNEESSFSKIAFKYPHDATIGNPITTLIIDYKKKNSENSLVRVLMGEMYGTEIDKSMQGFTKVGTKTINDIEWTVYKDQDGRTNYGFNIDYSNIVIGFIYDDEELIKFEQEFMNNVELNI
jgi:hypothetical protein